MGENIFLFVPNLIGYSRIILALLSIYFMPRNHVIAASSYILSGFLDSFDGQAARLFNQSTRFVSMLDMLTDLCSTMCLLVTLGQFYPKYIFWFQVPLAIDIASHWLPLHTTALLGRSSHKDSASNPNPILQLYYTSKPILFVMCFGNELFYSMLYLLHFTEGPILIGGMGLFRLLCYFCTPIALLKSILSLMKAREADLTLGILDAKRRAASKPKSN